MSKDELRLYKVIETADMSAEHLQEVLNNATDDFREMQIDYVVGTKIILGYDSMLNAKGRVEARNMRIKQSLSPTLSNSAGGAL